MSTLLQNSEHCLPYPLVKVPFTIRVDKDYHQWPQKDKETIVDCDVWIDDPVRDYILAFTSSKHWNEQLRLINEIDDKLALTMQQAKISVARAKFFKEYAEDPIGVMMRWLVSQERDLAIILGEVFATLPDGSLPDNLRKGGEDSIWSSEQVREAVNYMLSKPEAMAIVRAQQGHQG
jgi:SWI/SNF-related matrix-associated actin-dependent regulator of chromatin subfamily D